LHRKSHTGSYETIIAQLSDTKLNQTLPHNFSFVGNATI